MNKSFICRFRFSFISIVLFALFPITSIRASESKENSPIIFQDFFTNGADEGWKQINRIWSVSAGRYILDGGYMPDAEGRDGFAVIHEGDTLWRNYVMEATFDNSNPSGLPSPEVHNAMFFVRVKSQPPDGTFYRVDVWPFGTSDPRTGVGVLPGGLVQLVKYVNGSAVSYTDREYSNSVAGTNTITINVAGNNIVVIVNGKQVLTWSDNSDPIRYGGIGVGAIWEAEAWFDNIVVRPPGHK